MRYQSFYSNFNGFRRAKDKAMVNDILLHQLASVIVNKRNDVIDKLNQSGVSVDSSISERDLTQMVMDNLTNSKFVYGLSLIIAKNNKNEFENLIGLNKNKKKEQKLDVIGDVANELKTINKKDVEDLKNRVGLYKQEAGIAPSESGGIFIAVAVVALCALGIYLSVESMETN